MNHHPESTVQYSGPELEGGDRDVTGIGRVVAELRLEWSLNTDEATDLERARTLARIRDEEPAFREQPPATQ